MFHISEKNRQTTIHWIMERQNSNTKVCTKNNPDIILDLNKQLNNYQYTMENMKK